MVVVEIRIMDVTRVEELYIQLGEMEMTELMLAVVVVVVLPNTVLMAAVAAHVPK